MADVLEATRPSSPPIGRIERDPPTRFSYAAVFLIALVPRLALSPWFRRLGTVADEHYYWDQSALPFFRPQFRPPLWPLVLKLARMFSSDPFAGRLLSVVLGSLFVVLVFELADRLFDRRTAWAAALIAAFYPDHVVWSHFLWAEILFSVLLVAACLALFPRELGPRTRPLAGSLVLGFALLSKEFALVMMAALGTAQLLLPGRNRIRTLAVSLLLFLVPIFSFMGAVYVNTGTFKWLFPAGIENMRRASSLRQADPQAGHGEDQAWRKTVASVTTPVVENLKRLWGARSFALWRLGNGHYGRPVGTWVLILFVLVHGCILATGVIGLICETDPRWRLLALGCIAYLSLSALPIWLLSRFRTSFMFLFILGTARVVATPRAVGERLTSPARALACFVAIALIAVLLISTFPDVRRWS